MAIDIKDIEYTAKLAKLELSEEEKIRLSGELNALRGDIKEPSMEQKDVLANAPDTKDGYFIVPRVIE